MSNYRIVVEKIDSRLVGGVYLKNITAKNM